MKAKTFLHDYNSSLTVIVILDLLEVSGTVRNQEIHGPNDHMDNFRKDLLNPEECENNP